MRKDEISIQEKEGGVGDSKLLALSNDIAEYPPTNLTMHEWQALIVLSSIVNSKEHPIVGIDDIKEIAKSRGLTTKVEQNRLLTELVDAQKRYEMTYDEFFSFYNGETPLTRKTKKDLLTAMETLGSKSIVTANSDKLFASFNWFDGVINDKKNKRIKYFLGQVSQRLLMGLDKNFLQMMARLSVNEAKKHDFPIFLHMKSKLHSKQESYANQENLDDFKARFGHDKIPSYVAWKDYYRRVLKPAEDYAAKSGDIAVKFEGKTTKGRKVTHIAYKIWRIGNIHLPQTKGISKQKNERRTKWEVAKAKLTVQQIRGFDYLQSLEINQAFLIEECLTHKCMKHEVIFGYEDMFLKLLWTRFVSYTKANKKAGAFVVWWRRGRLTEGDHYWAVIDVLSSKKKSITQEEADDRAQAAQLPKAEYVKLRKEQKSKLASTSGNNANRSINIKNVNAPEKKLVDNFDLVKFKKKYPQQFKKIEEKLLKDTLAIYGISNADAKVSKSKMQEVKKQVNKMLSQHCELWYEKQKGN